MYKKLLVLLMPVLVVLFSCDVGLGSTVDREAPKISITYPPAAAVIREDFLLAGSWSDDKTVRSVTISVIDEDGKLVDCPIGQVDVNTSKRTWSVLVNSKVDGQYPLKDGKYTFNAMATDESGRSSGLSSRTFEIDNTYPVFMIKKPGIVYSDSNKPSVYGSVFKVTGNIADDHDVSRMRLTIYDTNGTTLGTWLSNGSVETAGGTEVTFARYYVKDTEDPFYNASYASNYDSVYKNCDDKGNAFFTCKIEVSDASGIWRTAFSANPDDKNNLGNTTSCLYLYDDIYEKVLKNKNIEVSDLKKIINDSIDDKYDLKKELLTLKNDDDEGFLTDTSKTPLYFSLNKKADPTYEFTDYILGSSSESKNTKAGKNSKVIFNAYAGLDSINLDPSSIKLFMFGPYDSYNDDFISSIYSSPFFYYQQFTGYSNGDTEETRLQKEEKGRVSLIYDGSGEIIPLKEGIEASDANITKSFNIPHATLGKFYVFAASGRDKEDLILTNGAIYGFVGLASGEKPVITFDSPKELVNSFDSYSITGKVQTPDSTVNSITYTIKSYDSENKVIDTKEASFDCGNSSEEAFEVIFTDSAVQNVMYKYVVTITATNKEGTDASKEFSFNLDTVPPVVNISGVSPIASQDKTSYIVNGKIKISGSISDTNLESSILEVSDATKSTSYPLGSVNSFERIIDTTEFEDNKYLSIKLMAKDKAGNETSTVINESSDIKYLINQASDYPKIDLNITKTDDFVEWNEDSTDKSNFFDTLSNNKFTGLITDDDGVGSVTVTYIDSNKESTEYTIQTSGKTVNLSRPLPSSEGNYTLIIKASDVVTDSDYALDGVTRVKDETYFISIDNAYPIIKLDSKDNTKANVGKFTITGTITETNGLKNFVRYTKDNDVEAYWDGSEESSITVIKVLDDKGNFNGEYKFTDVVDIGTEISSITKYYYATDVCGKRTNTQIKLCVDLIAPTLVSITNPTEDSYVYDGTNKLVLTGKVLDQDENESSYVTVNSVKVLISKEESIPTIKSPINPDKEIYDLSKGTWENATVSSGTNAKDNTQTFNYSINEREDGQYYVYIAVIDDANNQSYVCPSSRVTLISDTTAPNFVSITGNDKALNASNFSLLSSEDGSLNDYYNQKVVFKGTVEDTNLETLKVTYKKDNDKAVTKEISLVDTEDSSLKTWVYELTEPGVYTSIDFVLEDKAGYTSSLSYSTTIDTTVPNIKEDPQNKIFGTDWNKEATKTLNFLVNDTGIDGKAVSSGIDVYCIFNGEKIDLTLNGGALTANGTSNSSDGPKVYSRYSLELTFKEGYNSLLVYAKDKAGNEASVPNNIYYLDTTRPTVTILGETSYEMNGATKGDYELKLSLEDPSSSGIEVSSLDKIVLTKDSKEVKSYALTEGLTEGEYTLVIPNIVDGKEIINEGTNNFNISVLDKAGNTSESASFTIYCDLTPPTVNITNYKDKDTVNKTITLSGTVSESNITGRSAVDTDSGILQIYNPGTKAFINIDGSVVINGSEWTVSGIDTTKFYNGYEKSDFDYNTSSEDGVQLKFRVIFSDNFGNQSSGEGILLDVDQDGDRPVIEFKNISLDGNTYLSRDLSFVVYDDDSNSNQSVKNVWWTKDTSSTKVPTIDNSNGWNACKSESSNMFSIEGDSLSVNGNNDGKQSILFYIIDNEDGSFISNASDKAYINRIYIKDNDGTKINTSNSYKGVVNFYYDSVEPSISLSVCRGDDNGSKCTEDWDSYTVFGIDNYIYIKATVEELVAMREENPVELNINAPLYKSEVSNGVYTYIYGPIHVSEMGLSTSSFTINAKAYDASGRSSPARKQIIVDNKAPTVYITSPKFEESDAVIGSISVTGICQDDSSKVSRLRYLIPTIKQYEAYKSNNKITADEIASKDTSNSWKELSTSASWSIEFSSGALDSPSSLLYYASNPEVYNVTKINEGIYKVPFFFYTEDTSGNKSVITTNGQEKELALYCDVESGKPRAWISSPDEYSVLSGIVNITGGSSSSTSAVSKVCVQFDMNGDGLFDLNDYEILKTKYESEIYKEGLDWYLPCTGTENWKRSIDTSLGGKDTIKVRVRAIDIEGKTRSYSEPTKYKVDISNPIIKDIKLVQYGLEGEFKPISEREYISGMFLSNKTCKDNGKWYLTATITDDNLKGIKFNQNISYSAVNISLAEANDMEFTPTKSEYELKLPLETSSSGQINYTIEAYDENNKTYSVNILISIDSTEPSLFNTSNAESSNIQDKLRVVSLSENLSSTKTIKNSDGYFTFGDCVVEGESGLNYLAFYFERTGSVDRIYDPLMKASRLNIGEDVVLNEDGLPVIKYSKITRDSEDSFEIDGIGANSHIRQGGLVRIAGSYSRIASVVGDKVSFSPSVSLSFTDVEIVIAQVVDHMLVEKDDLSNDDGDGMIESLTGPVGSKYTWSASLDSSYLVDGPINLHVVAIDKAGNTTTGYVKTYVENNKPRLTKVLLATDLNGNGTFDYKADESSSINNGYEDNKFNNEKRTSDGQEFGEFVYYHAMNTSSGASQDKVTLDSKDFKVKDKLCILPEFVGGNGGLKYVVSKSSSMEKETGNESSLENLNKDILANLTSSSKDKLYAIDGHVSGFGGIIFDNENDFLSSNGDTILHFTFWDETEELTQGLDSQYAVMNVPLNVMTIDTEKPTLDIKDFYWNSESDNSVYSDEDGNLHGHIELDTQSVSGKVKLQGTISDDIRLGGISIQLNDDFNTEKHNLPKDTIIPILKYINGSWKYIKFEDATLVDYTVTDTVGGVTDHGWEMRIINETLNQNGHSIDWEMVVDTERLGSVVGNNKSITIIASDSYKSANIKSYERGFNVVPYITAIETSLSEADKEFNTQEVYSRASTGEYPVRVGETIKVYGYNLKEGTTSYVLDNEGEHHSLAVSSISNNTSDEETLDIFKCGTKYVSIVIPEDCPSGLLNIEVDGIEALNNSNNNDAHGTSKVDTTYYANYYNRRPNGTNNNLLTDDIKLEVWNFDTVATPVDTSATNVHMEIAPYSEGSVNSGRLGFSFSSGVNYWDMPGHDVGQESLVSSDSGFILKIPTNCGYSNIYAYTSSDETKLLGSWPGKSLSSCPKSDGYYWVSIPDQTSIYVMLNNNSNDKEVKKLLNNSSSTCKYYKWNNGTYNEEASTSLPETDIYSYTRMGSNYQGFTSSTFTFDKNGESYGVALCSDGSGSKGVSANLQFFSRATGTDDFDTGIGEDLNFNYLNTKNARRIENCSYYTDYNTSSSSESVKVASDRVQSPSMNTYVKDGITYVYLAYYDKPRNMIKFRVGSVGSTANSIGLGLKDLNGLISGAGGTSDEYKIRADKGTLKDSLSSAYVGDSVYGEANAYKYVMNLGTSSGSSTSVVTGATRDGKAIVAWFDGSKLRMKYTDFDSLINANSITPTWTEKVISSKGGKDVCLKVDSDGGLHYAYQSKTGSDLYYTYLSSVDSSPVELIVDAYGEVGTYCSIDVGRSSVSGSWIPYITYKRAGDNYAEKIAYPVKGITSSISTKDQGSSSFGLYTGTWTVYTIPSSVASINDDINVALTKTWDNDVIMESVVVTDPKAINKKGSWDRLDSKIIGCNGTKNPVVGYAGTNGSVMKGQKQ